ncbi:SIMPL domain-containing protein [Sporosarcina sp. SAFN-015]|uniref:SIMPL domain-containing protein n=1 Tax=Sporosarcina sp. SAFN-015 TaxID=3387274 RepID=UPI003F7D2C4E
MYYPYIRQQVRQSARSITVVGQGEVLALPDTAVNQLEVNTTSEQLSEAQRENAAIMTNIIQALDQLGIQLENIQTVNYSIFPRYDYVNGEQIFKGYEVSNSISVKLTNIQQVGEVIDTAVEHGANRVSNIQFSVENVDRYKQESIVKALQNAQMKAQTIADTLQLQIAPQPVRVTEVENGSQSTPFFKAAMSESVSTPIEGGQISVRSTMRVQYEY